MHHRPMIASLCRRARFGIAGVLAVLGCGPLSTAGAAEPPRAPDTDALCSWGRLSDGRGRLVRCLTREESVRLREAPPPASAAPAGAPPALPAPATPPSSPPTDSREPAPIAETVVVPPAPSAPPAPEGVPLDVEIGPISPDTGALPDALKSLSKARDRLTACGEKNGGLSAERASVELRFLVQGLGRAEGVSVKKYRGMSESAAKCIAGVVDRRYVGYPDEPAVGVTMVVTLSKKKR
jgi:hypothetical protein